MSPVKRGLDDNASERFTVFEAIAMLPIEAARRKQSLKAEETTPADVDDALDPALVKPRSPWFGSRSRKTLAWVVTALLAPTLAAYLGALIYGWVH